MTTATEPSASTPATAEPAEADFEAAGALIGRLFEAALGAFELATIYLGVKLGLYQKLTENRWCAETLSQATGLDQRYLEEWLEQQAIAGLIDVVDPGERATRTYRATPAQALVLADPDSPFSAVGVTLLTAGIGNVLPRLLEVFHTGEGISFGEYGDEVRDGQSLFNKTSLLTQLATEWVGPLGVGERLGAHGATALDVGTGTGWLPIALAQAYPGLVVTGIDSDEASIMDARSNAAAAGVPDRARFEVAKADSDLGGPYDVAFYFEALHDFGHPVQSLVAVREQLKPGGLVVVVDERAEEEFAPNGSLIERLYAASSVGHCLPVGRSEADSAATGTLLRPSILKRYAAAAGYASVEVAPIEHDFFRFYVLRP